MTTLVRVLALSLSFSALSFSSFSFAQTADAGAPLASSAPPASSASSAPNVVDSNNAESFVERVPSGNDRPHFT